MSAVNSHALLGVEKRSYCAGVSSVCKCAGVSCVEMAESRWASELSALQTSQRHKYRDCVMKLHEHSHLSHDNSSTHSPTYRSVIGT